MPLLGILHFVIAIGFAYHASQTGRTNPWLYILVLVPFLGSVAYVLIELLPELAQTRSARKVGKGIGQLVDPDREWRERVGEVERTGSIEAKVKLARECARRGMWADAAELYRTSATGIYKDDPAIHVGLAEAQVNMGEANAALATLDALRVAQPDLESASAHLVYARALEALGRIDQAMGEYEELNRYSSGYEARVRYALLLVKRGEVQKAQLLFKDVVGSASRRQADLTDDERVWVKTARANVEG